LLGKTATRQASLGGFSRLKDVLYLLPLATLCNALVARLLLAASICAPLYAIWVVIDFSTGEASRSPAWRLAVAR